LPALDTGEDQRLGDSPALQIGDGAGVVDISLRKPKRLALRDGGFTDGGMILHLLAG
jgi:hypothetical protein